MNTTLRAGVWPSFGALIQPGQLGTAAALMIAAPNPAPADQLIEVAAGDSAGLMGAIQAANQSPDKTLIRLNGSLDYRFDLASMSGSSAWANARVI
jgi:hypothetical protein